MKKIRVLSKVIQKLVLAIGLFTITASCNRDDEPVLLVFSGDVEIFSENGAVFTARVSTNMDEPVANCGFTWRATGLSDVVYEIELGPLDSELFSYHVVSGMRPETAYEMQAWVVIGDKKALGQKVKFTSLGSQDPVITGLYPQAAHWGDTIEISGRNFPHTNSIHLKFGSYASHIVSSSDTLLRITVPDALNDTLVNIGFQHTDNLVISTQSFRLKMPEIFSVTPDEGTVGAEILVTGKGFNPEYSILYIGNNSMEIETIKRDSIWGVLPIACNTGDYDIQVITHNLASNSKTLYYQLYELSYLQPSSASWLDVVELYGTGLDLAPNKRSLFCGNFESKVLSWTNESIKFVIPDEAFLDDQIPIVLKFDNSICNVGIELPLKKPVIDSVVPNTIPLQGTVRLYGRNFHPLEWKNRFSVGGVLGSVYDFTEGGFTFDVPFSVNHYNLDTKLKVNGLVVSGPNISITPQKINSISKDTMYWNDNVNLNGAHFHPNSSGNKVVFESTTLPFEQEMVVDHVYSTNTLRIIYFEKFLPHGNYRVSHTMLTRTVFADDLIYVISPYERLADPPFGSKVKPIHFTVNDRHYVGGGRREELNYFDDLWLFNLQTNSWVKKNDLPKAGINKFSFGTENFGYALIDTDFYRYSPETDHWENMGVFPDDFDQGIHFQINNDHYIAGQFVYSSDGQMPIARKIWKFIENENEWIRVADLPAGNTRWGIGFSIGGKGYIGLGQNTNHIWEYDPGLDTWEIATNVGLQFLSDFAIVGGSVAVVDDIAYIMGGWTNHTWNSPHLRFIYAFNPEDNSFKELEVLPDPWFYHGYIFSHNNMIYYGGGLRGSGMFVTRMFKIDPSVLTEYYFNP